MNLELPVPAMAVIDRVHNGETMTQIARSLGMGKSKLYAVILEQCPDEWRGTQVGIALERLENAQEELEGIDTSQQNGGAEVARVRARIASAQWQLERVCRRIYGNSVQVDVSQVIDVRIAIADARARVVNSVSVASDPPSTLDAQSIESHTDADDGRA